MLKHKHTGRIVKTTGYPVVRRPRLRFSLTGCPAATLVALPTPGLIGSEGGDAGATHRGIVDRSAFLADAIGAEAAVRVYHRLITLAVAYVLLRLPIA